MSVQSTDSLHNANMLKEELLCPVLLEPLSEAVSLVPCAHKIQKSVAETIFGSVDGEWRVQSKKPCPVCRVTVLGYMADHSVRNIVKQLFELPENTLNEMLATIKKELVEKCKVVEKDIVEEMSYPGKSAKFIHKSGNWLLYNSGGNLCRKISFISCTENSLINKFHLLGYKNGSVKISMGFSTENYNIIKKYLKQFDIILSDVFDETSYISRDHEQLKMIFKILAKNNEIPDPYFNMIRDIVIKGKHSP